MKQRSPTVTACGPEILMTANPPSPKGVAMAAMVSSRATAQQNQDFPPAVKPSSSLDLIGGLAFEFVQEALLLGRERLGLGLRGGQSRGRRRGLKDCAGSG